MTKKDLKTGMRVKYRDGTTGLVMLDTNQGSIICGKLWARIDDYNDDLTTNYNHREYDIIAVYEQSYAYFMPNLADIGDLIWEEALEVEEISADEAIRRLEQSSGKKIKITR
jgi:uncharacterized protein YkvS